MTATPRTWRATRPVDGPAVAAVADIPALNEVFTEAFSDRYRRDGMVGVRVPPLNPAIWRYAIEGAGDGAMLWRDDRQQHRGVQHRAPSPAWRGGWGRCACVRTTRVAGSGTTIVRAGMSWLRRSRCARDRPRDDAAHGGQHRLLRRRSASCPGRSRSRSRSRRPRDDAAAAAARRACRRSSATVDRRGMPRAHAAADARATTSRGRSSSRARTRSATRCCWAIDGAVPASRSATPPRWWRGVRATSCACSSWCSARRAAMPADGARAGGATPGAAARRASRSACRDSTPTRFRLLIALGRPRALDRPAHERSRLATKCTPAEGLVLSNWEI